MEERGEAHEQAHTSGRTIKIDPAYAAMYHIEMALRNVYKL
jgi:hypothetical protein